MRLFFPLNSERTHSNKRGLNIRSCFWHNGSCWRADGASMFGLQLALIMAWYLVRSLGQCSMSLRR